MKAVILNSGMGSRMGVLTSEHPKCMTEISANETILSRQLRLLAEAGISEVVMTTGLFDSVLVNYCKSLDLPLQYTFVKNPVYRDTNYIYSIYCAREHLDDEIVLMHGDLVFEYEVLEKIVSSPVSCMTVSSTLPLPEKDFKAVAKDGIVYKVGIEFFNDAMATQALYHLRGEDWKLWLDRIVAFLIFSFVVKPSSTTLCCTSSSYNVTMPTGPLAIPMTQTNSRIKHIKTPSNRISIARPPTLTSYFYFNFRNVKSK